MKRPVILSGSHDPACNLALEEELVERGEPVLYLWSNEPAVVIGRNQNPYKECDLEKLRADGVHLMRRRSGGGAVYHDRGNLNFTLISPRREDNTRENFDFVRAVLARCGVDAQVSGRNDLTVGEKKISGSAFFENEQIFCHHGTLLVDLDMNRLGNYLTASPLKLQAKGIDSVRARVENLSALRPGLTVDAVVQAFCEEWNSGVDRISEEDILEDCAIRKRVEKYRSWEWTFGECPRFNVSLEEKFSWGLLEADLYVESGQVKTCKIFTDSIIDENFNELAASLEGEPLKPEKLCAHVREHIGNEQLRQDLLGLFAKV